jgi:hypothetical protein
MSSELDRYYEGWGPRLSHLVKPGGLSGEVLDLREDVELALRNVAEDVNASQGGSTTLEKDIQTLKTASATLAQADRYTKESAFAETDRRVAPLEDLATTQDVRLSRLEHKTTDLGQVRVEAAADTERRVAPLESILSGHASLIDALQAALAQVPKQVNDAANDADLALDGLGRLGSPAKTYASTTDATPTVIASVAPPAEQAMRLTAEVLGVRADGLEAAMYSVLALARAMPASDVLTIATNPLDNETVTLGSDTYRFKTAMAAAYDVQIGGSAGASLDNLIAAINGTGTPGTEYYAGTDPNADATAAKASATTIEAVAIEAGTAGNSLVATDTLTAGGDGWGGGGTLAGGTAMSTFGVVVTTEHEDAAAWNVTVAVNVGQVEISVTGEADTDISWTAIVKTQDFI